VEEGEQRAKELAVMFIETSAKTSYNVKQVGAVNSTLLSLSTPPACVLVAWTSYLLISVD